MKKILALSLSMIMLFSVTACGEKEAKKVPSETQTKSSEEVKEPETTSEPETTPTEESNSKDTSEESQENATEETTEPTETTSEQTSDADISSAIDAETTSETNTVPLGQWTKTARYATQDKTYHTVYVRVTKVTTTSDDEEYVKSAVDLHNTNSYDFQQIDTSKTELPSDVELCVLDYEVFVPEEFPTSDSGLVEPSMDFSQSNIGGGGIPSADGTSSYIGLGSNTKDLAMEKDPTYAPGNTYNFRSLFTMVKGYTDYVLEFTSYPDGTLSDDTSADIMYHAYLAVK